MTWFVQVMTKEIHISKRITRREKRAILKLWHSSKYKKIISFFTSLLFPVKFFIYLPVHAARKAYGVISLTVYKLPFIKLGYVDDFIVHKKLRWKWHAQKLFSESEKLASNKDCDYIFLFSAKERKASHKFYKKMWLITIWLWLWVFAYKKITTKK